MDLLRHIFAPALLLAALLCVPACDGHKDDVGEGTGTLIVNISNPVELETRHASGEGSDASDGGLMKTLRVWLVTDGNGYRFVNVSQRAFDTPQDTAIVRFADVTRGNYMLLIAANYTELDSYGVTEFAMNDNWWAALAGAEVAAGESPAFDDVHGMPLSFEKNISVGAGENIIDASLRRCVGRLTFNVRNNLDEYELFIHSIGLSPVNRTCGKFWESEGAAGDLVAFPDLPDMDQDGDEEKDGLVQVGPREYKNVYDIYLYETNPGDSIKFDMLAALYPKDTEKSSVAVMSRIQDSYEFWDDQNEFISTSRYLIRSAYSSNFYLGDNGSGTLVATEFTADEDIKNDENIINYFWKFSSSTGNATTIQNVGTGNYLSISSSGASLSSSSPYIRNTQSRNGGLRFYDDNNYNIIFDGNSISTTTDYKNKKSNWYVREVSNGTSEGTVNYFVNPTKEIPRIARPIKYIDNYGASQLLTKIDRNEHVTVNINVFYNRELGQFQFEVLDWNDDGDHQTTFD